MEALEKHTDKSAEDCRRLKDLNRVLENGLSYSRKERQHLEMRLRAALKIARKDIDHPARFARVTGR